MARKKKKIETVEVVEEATTTEIDQAQISEEDLENSGLSDLVARGKEQGFLTYEEINFMLPEDISDPDQVEETIQMLVDIGIEVLERTSEGNEEGAAETVPDTRTTLTTVESDIVFPFLININL